MELLVLGVSLWCVAHLLKSLGAPLRRRLQGALGSSAYQGVIALALVGSLVLMVLGWRAAVPTQVYAAPAWGRVLATPLVFLGLYLFAVSAMPSNVKRFLRHPQLTGFALWALAHLLSNGDARSLVLFGTLGVWAVVEMPLINRRDGPREPPGPEPLAADLKLLAAALVAFGVLFFLHPFLFGVSPSPV